jgi:hypothetical protein
MQGPAQCAVSPILLLLDRSYESVGKSGKGRSRHGENWDVGLLFAERTDDGVEDVLDGRRGLSGGTAELRAAELCRSTGSGHAHKVAVGWTLRW